MRLLFTCWLIGQGFFLQSQANDHQFIFQPTLEGENIVLGESIYSSAIGDSLSIDQLKFYISNIKLLKKNLVIQELDQEHYFINLNDPTSNKISYSNTQNWDAMIFELGIDSLTNAGGAMGADLDPTNGMYWTWQSGYINLKLEGRCMKCPTRENEFQFHLGGFQGMDNALQTVRLKVKKGKNSIIYFPLDNFVQYVDWSQDCEIMSPGEEAVKLSSIIAHSFKLKN